MNNSCAFGKQKRRARRAGFGQGSLQAGGQQSLHAQCMQLRAGCCWPAGCWGPQGSQHPQGRWPCGGQTAQLQPLTCPAAQPDRSARCLSLLTGQQLRRRTVRAGEPGALAGDCGRPTMRRLNPQRCGAPLADCEPCTALPGQQKTAADACRQAGSLPCRVRRPWLRCRHSWGRPEGVQCSRLLRWAPGWPGS